MKDWSYRWFMSQCPKSKVLKVLYNVFETRINTFYWFPWLQQYCSTFISCNFSLTRSDLIHLKQMITSINISINPRQKIHREHKLPVICMMLWLPICIASDWERTSNTLLSPILIVCSQPSACGLKNKTFTVIIVKNNPIKTHY